MWALMMYGCRHYRDAVQVTREQETGSAGEVVGSISDDDDKLSSPDVDGSLGARVDAKVIV